jgi:hypothetical protein
MPNRRPGTKPCVRPRRSRRHSAATQPAACRSGTTVVVRTAAMDLDDPGGRIAIPLALEGEEFTCELATGWAAAQTGRDAVDNRAAEPLDVLGTGRSAALEVVAHDVALAAIRVFAVNSDRSRTRTATSPCPPMWCCPRAASVGRGHFSKPRSETRAVGPDLGRPRDRAGRRGGHRMDPGLRAPDFNSTHPHLSRGRVVFIRQGRPDQRNPGIMSSSPAITHASWTASRTPSGGIRCSQRVAPEPPSPGHSWRTCH